MAECVRHEQMTSRKKQALVPILNTWHLTRTIMFWVELEGSFYCFFLLLEHKHPHNISHFTFCHTSICNIGSCISKGAFHFHFAYHHFTFHSSIIYCALIAIITALRFGSNLSDFSFCAAIGFICCSLCFWVLPLSSLSAISGWSTITFSSLISSIVSSA